ncbi:MAG: DUF5684 domain-containing protein [Flavobacteriales bacterium]
MNNDEKGMIAFMVIFMIAIVVIGIVMIISMWKIFEKAGKPGWACLVPIYNNMVMAEIGGKESWFGLLPMIPYIGVIWSIWIQNRLSKSFGKEVGFTLGMIFLPLIFYPILAFGEAEYVGHPDQAGRANNSSELLD